MAFEGIRVLSRKEKNINFRTASHNFLLREDDQYDGRFFGALQTQSRVRALYSMTIKSYVEEPVRRAREAIERVSSKESFAWDGLGPRSNVEVIAIISGIDFDIILGLSQNCTPYFTSSLQA